jgi:hypothetical protein
MNSGLIFSQEALVKEKVAQGTENESEIQWIWAELVSVDAQKNEIAVKYFDYEIDEEKNIIIVVDNKTTYENIKSINELKLGNALSIDYAVDSEGKNIARNISVEKPESSQPEPEAITPEKSETIQETTPSQ